MTPIEPPTKWTKRPPRKATSVGLTAKERAAVKAWMRFHPTLAAYADSKRAITIGIRHMILERLQKEGLLEPPPVSPATGARIFADSTSPDKRRSQTPTRS